MKLYPIIIKKKAKVQMGPFTETVHAVPSVPSYRIAGPVNAHAVPSMPTAKMVGSIPAHAAPSVPKYAMQGNVLARATPSMPALKMVGQEAVHAVPSMPALKMVGGGLTAHAAPSAPKLSMKGAISSVHAVPSMPKLSMVGSIAAHAKPSVLKLTAKDLLVTQDIWLPEQVLGICADALTHNNDLIRLARGATPRDGYIGWDLSGFSLGSGGTVTACTIKLTTQNAQTLGTDSVTCGSIIAAWNEASVCPGPAENNASGVGAIALPAAANTQFSFSPNNAGFLTDLQNKVGVGVFGIRLVGIVGSFPDTERTLFDRESGTTAQRALLTFTIQETF